MNLAWFADLTHLDQTGAFSQAARLSHISQPALSRRIQALEAWVGVPLVDRSQQPVRLTHAGTQMLEAGHDALTRIESTRAQVRAAHALPDAQVVTFGAQHSIGWRFYPAWLQSFEAAYGPLVSRLRADNLPNCLRDLDAGQVDFVIAYQGQDDPAPLGDMTTEAIIIGHDRLIPVCQPDAQGRPRYDFAASRSPLPLLRFGADAPISRPLAPLFAAHGLTTRLTPIYENSMAGALRIRAKEGAGIAWLPQSLVAPDLEAATLVRTGDPAWEVALQIRLHRNPARTTRLTRGIWAFLSQTDPPGVPDR